MLAEGESEERAEDSGQEKRAGWLDRHPKLSILLIAAVFYLILFAMCLTVAVLLIWKQRG